MLSGTPALPGSKDNVSDVCGYLTGSCSQWFQPLTPPPPQLCCDKGQSLGAAKSLTVNDVPQALSPLSPNATLWPPVRKRCLVFPHFTKGAAVSLGSSLRFCFLNITLHMESALGEEKL